MSKRTGEHLIRVDVYAIFVCSIQKNCPGLKDKLRAFGTDGDKPLEQSFSEGFPSAIKLLWLSHFGNNVKEHLNVLD